jgi:hypothetical protein
VKSIGTGCRQIDGMALFSQDATKERRQSGFIFHYQDVHE